ncbi:hypothetical protein [Mammaliicoccus lentus]|uniref:hypothetical protein n=1 Tax=Mammaliicoccus lentus TaxID=42858 RepID=UPI001B32ECD9|nr:hypothetical protein [Mammaliicoccus lentus]
MILSIVLELITLWIFTLTSSKLSTISEEQGINEADTEKLTIFVNVLAYIFTGLFVILLIISKIMKSEFNNELSSI